MPRGGRGGNVLGVWALVAALGGLAGPGCRGEPQIPRAFGLSLQADRLRLTLSIGCLNDRDFAPLGAVAFRDLTSRTEGLLRGIPGLALRLIPDQPMDAQFLMERTAARSRARARVRAQDRLLSLSPGMDNRRVWERAGRPAGVLESLARAHTLRAGTGLPFLYDKLPSSDFAWRTFMADQGRNDIVLTNAFVFPDDLGTPPRTRDHLGGVRGRLLPTGGRQTLEGWGALVSINEELRPGGTGVKPDVLASRFAAVILALVVPLSEESARAAIAALALGKPLLEGCGECRTRWVRRRRLLRALVLLRESSRADACRGIGPTDVLPAGVLPAGIPAEEERRASINRGAAALVRLCSSKRE